jgi:group I intron endonuclease
MPYYTYKITNLVNGKIYIGKTANIRKRWNGHKTAANTQNPNDYSILHRAIRKYGANNFSIEQLSEHTIEKEALAQEQVFIAQFQAKDRNIGYNLTDGGDGISGYKLTPEQRKKLSIARKGQFIGEANPFFGGKHSSETIGHLSDIAKKRYTDDKEKYDALNIAQCDLTTEQCVNIQKQYSTENISFEELANNFSTSLHAIHNIIHGTYSAIRGHSILTEDQIDQIINNRNKKQHLQYKSFTPEQEREIAVKYSLDTNLTVSKMAIDYGVSSPTIKKAIIAHGLKIRPRGNGR